MMARNPTRFDKKNNLDERQLKAFDRMYQDPVNYTYNDICERFGMAHGSIIELAKERGLKLRTGRV